ncbi:hypothetical protein HYFRA_00002325 [Hymenoscyphus fraxineus]|uniref:Serine hydrolase domain-containing protein n=1 Tax=Hymenoscyphus fraxineus TaxID=746836 RepID=A0A9N9PZ90_9HELO|nr:hypothetical protein HYFRA_00002325 [Hymenoscyphus fraxineus]
MAGIFETQTAALRYQLGNDHEYDFPDALLEHEPYPGLESLIEGPDGHLATTFSWFEQTIPSLLDALSDLADYIDSEGPFDGIIGFSQGAALAATYIAQYEAQNRDQLYHEMPFKCAVFICPGPVWRWEPRDGDEGELTHMDPDVEEVSINIPAAVIWGAADELAEGGRIVSEFCDSTTREKYVHPGGHEIPRKPGELKAMVKIVRAVMEKAVHMQ